MHPVALDGYVTISATGVQIDFDKLYRDNPANGGNLR